MLLDWTTCTRTVPRDCKRPAREGICHCEPIVPFVFISRVYGYEFLPNGVHCSERPPKIQVYEARPYRGWFARLRTFYNSSILIHPSTHSFVRYSVPRYNRSCISFPLIYVAKKRGSTYAYTLEEMNREPSLIDIRCVNAFVISSFLYPLIYR